MIIDHFYSKLKLVPSWNTFSQS